MTVTCLTIDIEDWYDGMAVLGQSTRAPAARPSGLSILGDLLATPETRQSRLTLFVVGNYAGSIAGEIRDLAAAGHELASHGPEHTTMPENPARLEAWLRRGREDLEQMVQSEVVGFRSPYFGLPPNMDLARYREVLARAGFRYVSDRCVLGQNSPIAELPAQSWSASRSVVEATSA